jgi:hypothetical protein
MTCFYSMVVWNKSDRKIERAAFGLAFTTVNYALTICYFADVPLKWYTLTTLLLVMLYTLNKFNVDYFTKKFQSSSGNFQILKKETRKKYLIIGTTLFVGSAIMVGISGHYLVKKHRLKLKQMSTFSTKTTIRQ